MRLFLQGEFQSRLRKLEDVASEHQSLGQLGSDLALFQYSLAPQASSPCLHVWEQGSEAPRLSRKSNLAAAFLTVGAHQFISSLEEAGDLSPQLQPAS
jgi:hypothetical protein